MTNQNVKPADGKLGIMVVGLGAVTSTFMTGVLMARKGLAKPVGSMTQYDKIRVGKGACHWPSWPLRDGQACRVPPCLAPHKSL